MAYPLPPHAPLHRPVSITTHYADTDPFRHARCWWYDASAGRWASDGLTVGDRPLGAITCLADRLGVFVGSYYPTVRGAPAEETGHYPFCVCCLPSALWGVYALALAMVALRTRLWRRLRPLTASGSIVVPDTLHFLRLNQLYNVWLGWWCQDTWAGAALAGAHVLLVVLGAIMVQLLWPCSPFVVSALWRGCVIGTGLFW